MAIFVTTFNTKPMIIVTGGAGFIGSNIIRALNERGHEDILVVDNLDKSEKHRNLNALFIADFVQQTGVSGATARAE